MKKPLTPFILWVILFCSCSKILAQNSMTGDGFGGRSWYVSYNYNVGSYSAYTVCGPNDQLYGWGNNVQGELGNGLNVSTTAPVPATGMTDVRFYASGYITSCIRKDSTAWAWGYLTNAAGIAFAHVDPKLMLSGVKFVDAGISHLVFIKYDSTVWALGRNNSGELGNGTTTLSTVPVKMTGVQNAVRAICLGYTYGTTIILQSDGLVKITGGYQWFTQVDSKVPVLIPGLTDIVDIKGNASAAFALNKNGEVFAFGTETQYGSLGLGLGQQTYAPPTKITFPAGAAPIIALSATNDGSTTLALDEDGKLYGWGGNFYAQLGDGTLISKSRPILVATNVIDMGAAETFSYIIKADKTIWATGQSGHSSGGSYGSIWMNLPNVSRKVFTQIDPTIAPMNICAPKPFGIITNPSIPVIDSSCRLDTNIKIFPIPAHKKIVIDKKPTTCNVTMIVYNTLGQLLFTNKIITDGRNEIDLTAFASGIYYIQFYSNGRTLLTKQLLKQ